MVEYTYDTWGKLISITGSLADTIGVKNPLRYRGYYYDTETSLYYLQSRYYDPEICRFINADVYVIAGDDLIQGTNMYAYCYNNPVMYKDYEGYSAAVAVGTAGVAGALVKTGTVGAANSWNAVGWVLLGVTAVGTAALVGYTVYQNNKTRTLADVTVKKAPTKKVYQLAYINSKGDLTKTGSKMTFTQALTALGITGATNSLSKIYKFKIKKASGKVRSLESKGENWGIFADSQTAAKALAVVFGYTGAPEVHGVGYYGHYHDSTHSFHIWYGKPIY